MSETAQEVKIQEDKNISVNPFSESSWEEEQPIEISEEQNNKIEDKKEITEHKKEEASIVDYNQFVKDNFGYDSVELAKQNFEELKRLKEQPKEQQFKFENEQSEKVFKAIKEGKLDEVSNYFLEQKRLERLTSSDLNLQTASEIYKLNLQLKNKELTAEDAEFLYNETFNFPKKPEQSLDETDDEYEQKINSWQTQVEKIERKLIIEAKLAKPELDKLKSELVLPDIQNQNNQSQPTQEELERINGYRRDFEQKLESNFKNFNGYTVVFKDEEVEIPISFVPTEDEKIAQKTSLSDFDSDHYFGSRWFDKEGKPLIEQMMADKYLLENRDKIFQKIANEAGNQRLLHKIKADSNINLGKSPQGTFAPQNEKTQLQLEAEYILMNG